MGDIDKHLAQLNDPDPESRCAAIGWLREHGDRSALPALEHALLDDSGGFAVEGALVDGWHAVADSAAVALEALYARVTLEANDEDRIYAAMARPRVHDSTATNGPADGTARLLKALRDKARPIAQRALTSDDPIVRFRGHLVLGGFQRAALEELVSSADEDMRFLALTRNPFITVELLNRAIDQLAVETSLRVRRAIASAWWRFYRYECRVPPERDFVYVLRDPDPEVSLCGILIARDPEKLALVTDQARLDRAIANAKRRQP